MNIENPFIYDDVEFNQSMKNFQKLANIVQFSNQNDSIIFYSAFGQMCKLAVKNKYFQFMFRSNLVIDVYFDY